MKLFMFSFFFYVTLTAKPLYNFNFTTNMENHFYDGGGICTFILVVCMKNLLHAHNVSCCNPFVL